MLCCLDSILTTLGKMQQHVQHYERRAAVAEGGKQVAATSLCIDRLLGEVSSPVESASVEACRGERAGN